MPGKTARKKSRKIKLGLAVLALVFGLLFLSWFTRFTTGLFRPFSGTGGAERNFSWQEQFNINLLVRTNKVSLFAYSPKEGKIDIIDLPDELFLEVPEGFGSWQLRSIYDLGGASLLVKTLMFSLGIPIDGFVDLSSAKEVKSASEIVSILRKNPFSGMNLLSSLKTDLTLWELIKLKWGVTKVRFDKIKSSDLLGLDVFDRQSLADGSRVLIPDPYKLDSIFSELNDPTILSEHKAIAIFNATDVPGLAQKWTRIITNIGGNVIITANASPQEKTQISGLPSKTLDRLRQIFGTHDKIDKSEQNSRAEINIILGEDLAK